MGSDSNDRPRRISVKTLMISALAALLAAVIVSLFWERGTLIATAITPVVVALVSEGLARPVGKVEEVASAVVARPPLTGERYEGAEAAPADESWEGETLAAHPDSEEAAPPADVRRRQYIGVAVVTGVLAFAIAAVVLTGTELATGGSLATNSRTTLFGSSDDSSKQDEDEPQSSQPADSPSDQGGGTDHEQPVVPQEEQQQEEPAPEETPSEESPPEEPEQQAPADASEAIAPSSDTTP